LAAIPEPYHASADFSRFFRSFVAEPSEAKQSAGGSRTGRRSVFSRPFVLPDLAKYEDKADDLAQALHEFVTIERFVSLNEWQTTRHAPPERRVLMGESLLVRYCEEDQDSETAEENRQHQQRERKRAEYEAQGRLGADQIKECQWSPEGMSIRLRLERTGLDCDLHDALALTNLRPGDRLILYPRRVVDSRLPPTARKEFTPTPRQLIYGQRCELKKIVATEHDASGRALTGYIEVELTVSFGGAWSKGFVFGGINKPLENGMTYTLDPCPNDWYGYWSLQVVEGLCRGEGNTLYDLLADPSRIEQKCCGHIRSG
jgi:hypothetical protein